jgi:hypothetical protein
VRSACPEFKEFSTAKITRHVSRLRVLFSDRIVVCDFGACAQSSVLPDFMLGKKKVAAERN